MLEPVVDAHAMSNLAKTLIERAAAAEPTIRAERELFHPLAQAYFRDRERALAGVAAPLTTLMLESARAIWDHLIEQTMRRGGPWPTDPSRNLHADAQIHRIITEVLTGTGHLPPERADRLADAIAGAPFTSGAVWLRGAA
jgi:hypothetical protein